MMLYPRLTPDQVQDYGRNEIRNYTTEKLIEYGRQCAELARQEVLLPPSHPREGSWSERLADARDEWKRRKSAPVGRAAD